ncbi:MAG: response regulator [Desulfuromonadaceae bacterium]|nr:response regulator [Desulfuromonadaceae bacterium]
MKSSYKNGAPMNVLIVEDTHSARKLLRITLEHYGCTVFEAQDGLEGLDRAIRHKPDIIISDALMPRMDGFEMLRALKSNPEVRSIPFIFYSSTYTGEKEAELALSLGAEAFLAKPVEPEELWKMTCAIMRGLEKHKKESAQQSIDEGDEQYLREYSRIVATKLEEKVLELEESLLLRKRTEEELRTLNLEMAREIAERRKAENILREQEEELATIFENAPFMMLLLDEERMVRRVNGMACSFTDSSVSEILNRRSGEALRCIHALDTPEGCGFGPYCRDCAVRLAVQDTFATSQGHHLVETTLPLTFEEEGQSVTLLFSTTKVMVAHQAMVLLSFQDISEYKKLEAELHHAQRMESIGALAGGIAHDFNNILTVIIGYGDITLLEMSATDPHRQNVEYMLQSARRAASLSQNLLLFSRKQFSDKKKVDLNEIVRELEKFLRRIIGEDIICTITQEEGAMPVLADAHQLEQVLMNLATNARDAMTNGGSLLISTERLQPDEQFIAAHGFGKECRYATLTVTDTGIGMDEQTRQRIFDPFFTTKEIGKGTGLGLAVVYGIIKQHDGQITVESEAGHGTTFRIYLPLIIAPVSDKRMDQMDPKPVGGTETILLAEDDENVRNMILSHLESFGYEVICAVDGEDAVLKFRENMERIRLLLFDVIMPKKKGIDAFDEIREIDPDAKVIFASGYAVEDVHQRALEDDNIIVISKPFLPSNLLTVMRSMLDKKII